MGAKEVNAAILQHQAAVTRAYNSYHQSLVGVLYSALNNKEVLFARQYMSKNLPLVAREAISQLTHLIDQLTHKVIAERFTERGLVLTPKQHGYIKTLGATLETQIVNQARLDKSQVELMYRQFVMRAELRAERDGIAFETALQMEQHDLRSDVTLYRADSLGRNFKSEMYVYVQVNMMTRKMLNEVPLADAISSNSAIYVHKGAEDPIEFDYQNIGAVERMLHPRNEVLIASSKLTL